MEILTKVFAEKREFSRIFCKFGKKVRKGESSALLSFFICAILNYN